jgi:hypothetical protein
LFGGRRYFPEQATILAFDAGNMMRIPLRCAPVGMTNSLQPKDETADPSAALGMTKGRVALPFGVMVEASQTSFIPPSTCQGQVTVLLMTRAAWLGPQQPTQAKGRLEWATEALLGHFSLNLPRTG